MKCPSWKNMSPDDLEEVVELATSLFPDHFEEPALFAERLRLSPTTCFALRDRNGLKGYLIAYPWKLASIPSLNTPLGRVPENADSVYVHDLALHPGSAGRGHARTVLRQLLDVARRRSIRHLALVAVNGSTKFWQANGFRCRHIPGSEAKLATYGDDAAFMVRSDQG